MQHFDYKPHGVCPMRISFDLEGDTVDQIEGYFRGISCNGRGTSCSDQLAQGVRQALESAK